MRNKFYLKEFLTLFTPLHWWNFTAISRSVKARSPENEPSAAEKVTT